MITRKDIDFNRMTELEHTPHNEWTDEDKSFYAFMYQLEECIAGLDNEE